MYHDHRKSAFEALADDSVLATSRSRLDRFVQALTKADYRQVIPVSLIVMLIAIWNGFPLLYEDAAGYIGRPARVLGSMLGQTSPDWIEAQTGNAERTRAASSAFDAEPDIWMAGRSAYWGSAAYLTTILAGPFGVVIMNALLSAVTLVITWFGVLGRASAVGLWTVAAILTAVTPLGLFVGLISPDILSGLFVLALAGLAVSWSTLSRLDRGLLLAITSFAALSHDSLIPLGMLLIIPCVAVFLYRIELPIRRRIFASTSFAMPVLAGLIGMGVFSAVAVKNTGETPLRLPFVTAHIASTEFGARAIAEECRTQSFEICRHADKLPLPWTNVLFARDAERGVFGVSTIEQKQRLGKEQTSLLIAAVKRYPLEAAGHFTSDVFKQLASFDLNDIAQQQKADTFRQMFTPSLYGAWSESRLAKDQSLIFAIDEMTGWLVIASLVAIAVVLWRRRKDGTERYAKTLAFAAIVLIGVVANAVVSGILASPWGRFEARLIWIVPFVAIAVSAMLNGGHKKGVHRV